MSETQSNIAIAEDEVVIRDYEITEVDYRALITKVRKKAPRRKRSKYNTTGRLMVTNRRVVYNVDNHRLPKVGAKCSDLYSQQVRIEDVQGVEFMTSSTRKPLWGPILLLILSIPLLAVMVGIPLLIVAAIWLYIRYKSVETSMTFGIRSGSSEISMFISEMSRGYASELMFWCAPTEQFEVMAKEIGAIILDLQKYGDDCLSKWVVTPGYTPGPNPGAGFALH